MRGGRWPCVFTLIRRPGCKVEAYYGKNVERLSGSTARCAEVCINEGKGLMRLLGHHPDYQQVTVDWWGGVEPQRWLSNFRAGGKEFEYEGYIRFGRDDIRRLTTWCSKDRYKISESHVKNLARAFVPKNPYVNGADILGAFKDQFGLRSSAGRYARKAADVVVDVIGVAGKSVSDFM